MKNCSVAVAVAVAVAADDAAVFRCSLPFFCQYFRYCCCCYDDFSKDLCFVCGICEKQLIAVAFACQFVYFLLSFHMSVCLSVRLFVFFVFFCRGNNINNFLWPTQFFILGRVFVKTNL